MSLNVTITQPITSYFLEQYSIIWAIISTSLRQIILETVLHTVQINFHPVDENKKRYIQTPIGLLIFDVKGHVYSVQCEVLEIFGKVLL